MNDTPARLANCSRHSRRLLVRVVGGVTKLEVAGFAAIPFTNHTFQSMRFLKANAISNLLDLSQLLDSYQASCLIA